MVFQEQMTTEDKLRILGDAAKYDVACTSSGMDRAGKDGYIGNSIAGGICHTFSADGRCISLLKVLYTNECVFNCKYCINRCSNDVVRASFTPEELCRLTIEFYRRNYIEGLFLSSGVLKSPTYTMEQMVITLKMLREQYFFNGYIHCKAVPGADPYLIEAAGWYADRMSVNLELPTAEALKELAPNKSRASILGPIRQIQNGIDQSRHELGQMGGNRSAFYFTRKRLETEGGSAYLKARNMLSLSHNPQHSTPLADTPAKPFADDSLLRSVPAVRELPAIRHSDRYSGHELTMTKHFRDKRGFAAAGQSTQMIIGATPENDFQLVSVAEALYERFDLKRVFYSAFINVNNESSLPATQNGPSLLREHRLYQADWLLRYYGFKAGEILSEKTPNFNLFVDPKCNWALSNMDFFPVEVNTADYFTLLRTPGIGPKSARRIVDARKSGIIRFEDLKRIGVVMKRAMYFITCSGKMYYRTPLDEDFIARQLMGLEKPQLALSVDKDITFRQMSLFDDMNFAANN